MERRRLGGLGAPDPGDDRRLAGSAQGGPDANGPRGIRVRRRRKGAPLRRALRPRGPVQFGVSTDTTPRGDLLRVTGELDILTAPTLSGELDAILRRSGDHLTVDLRTAVFIDSAGLHILLNACRRLGRRGRTLTVVCDDGPVRRVIELARLTETLGVVSSPEYAEISGPAGAWEPHASA